MKSLLQVTGLHVHYGVIEALKGIDFALAKGQITTLLGANGAGKSTTLLTLCGLVKPSAGSIYFDGVELRNLRRIESLHTALRKSLKAARFLLD